MLAAIPMKGPIMSLARRHLLSALALTAAATTLPAHALDITWGSATRVTGSGKVASETRAVSDFQAVATRGSIDLLVRQGARESVELRADDNLLPLIETVVEERNGQRTLVIGVKKGHSIQSRNDLQVTVDVVRLQAISTSGSGDVRVEALQTPSLKLALSGSSDAKFASLRTDDFTIAISGSGDVDAAGRAGRLTVNISGSGDVRLRELQTDDVKISIAGSGDAEVSAARHLDVSIAGSGNVRYHGDARVSSKIAGSGSVTRR